MREFIKILGIDTKNNGTPIGHENSNDRQFSEQEQTKLALLSQLIVKTVESTTYNYVAPATAVNFDATE